MFNFKYLKYDIHDDGVAFINLDRKPVNALNISLLNELDKVLDDIKLRDDIRVVIFRSLQKHFSAGADLKERSSMNGRDTLRFIEIINNVFNKIENLNVPTIASINGVALGGGLELALCCDFRIASENSLVGLTETSLGIIPGAGGIFRLIDLIGKNKSKYWIFTAQQFSSENAYQEGVIDFISSDDQLLGTTLELSQEILDNSPSAIIQAKSFINNISNERKKLLKLQLEYYKKVYKSDDKVEALKAFLEKRKPNWK